MSGYWRALLQGMRSGQVKHVDYSPSGQVERLLRRIDRSSPDYCSRCDGDTHACPGCGMPVPHDMPVCAQCQVDYAPGGRMT